jgi:hypothetical protein
MRRKEPSRPGYRKIFRRWITVNGRRVYRRNGGVFILWVKDE